MFVSYKNELPILRWSTKWRQIRNCRVKLQEEASQKERTQTQEERAQTQEEGPQAQEERPQKEAPLKVFGVCGTCIKWLYMLKIWLRWSKTGANSVPLLLVKFLLCTGGTSSLNLFAIKAAIVHG